MMRRITIVWLGLMALGLGTGGAPSSGEIQTKLKREPDRFADYWYQGKAELSRFRLKQARYGELHEGDAVLIYVTEDFLRDIQVKKEFGDGPADTVLKLNATRKFNTGIYPYSLMTSVFTKIDFQQPSTPKVSFSSQEWCGHIYSQMNLREGKYHTELHSYFQKEADRSFELPKAWLEDEIWTLIRIAPEKLPLGALEVIPSLQFSRLLHQEPLPLAANATLSEKKDRRFSKERLLVYKLAYEKPDRTLEIFFERQQPFRILGWLDRHQSGFGDRAQTLTTVAVRTHLMMIDYWNKNRVADKKLRKELGLD